MTHRKATKGLREKRSGQKFSKFYVETSIDLTETGSNLDSSSESIIKSSSKDKRRPYKNEIYHFNVSNVVVQDQRKDVAGVTFTECVNNDASSKTECKEPSQILLDKKKTINMPLENQTPSFGT